MENKTKFKLHYIHSHVKKSRLIRPSKTYRKTAQNNPQIQDIVPVRLPLLKFYSPFTILRTIGDFAYLDQSNNFDEYVPYSALTLHFKQVKEIKTSANFTICSMQDYEEPFMNIDYLFERLLSLNDQNSYDLALCLKRNAEKHKSVDISGKKDDPNLGNLNEKAFFKILDENANEPMIFYHYVENQKLGLIIHKMAVNKCLKDLTNMNDLQIFQEGPLVIPGKDYYQFMHNHLNTIFGEKNQVITNYLQSAHGILKVFSHVYQVILSTEIVLILVFPKNIQEAKVQLIYESVNGKKEIEETKENQKKITKNMDEWDNVIKKYYAPWIFKEGNKRCGYKLIEEDQ